MPREGRIEALIQTLAYDPVPKNATERAHSNQIARSPRGSTSSTLLQYYRLFVMASGNIRKMYPVVFTIASAAGASFCASGDSIGPVSSWS